MIKLIHYRSDLLIISKQYTKFNKIFMIKVTFQQFSFPWTEITIRVSGFPLTDKGSAGRKVSVFAEYYLPAHRLLTFERKQDTYEIEMNNKMRIR